MKKTTFPITARPRVLPRLQGTGCHSQFYNPALTLNPALAGAIQGDQRFALILVPSGRARCPVRRFVQLRCATFLE
jgi:hypothetical protein